jgi:sugar lactone lactonase YvrE
MRTTTADVARDEVFDLGEGPIWQAPDRLTWVDLLQGVFNVATVTGSEVSIERRYEVGMPVGAALPLADRDAGWLLAAASGFAHLAPDGTVRVLAEPEADQRALVRMNDAKCDPAGRLWAGSMANDERPGAGSLFRVDLDGSVTRVLRDRQVSNGIDWSPDGRTFYYSDSGHAVVYHAPYDLDRGEIGPLSPLIEPPEHYGATDGLTVDAEGMLWVAFWGGGAVRRYDPSGRVLEEVRTGAPQTTSCCLGGEDGRTLFITSAANGLSPAVLAEHPDSGRLFATRVDVPGPPARPFLGALPHGGPAAVRTR